MADIPSRSVSCRHPRPAQADCSSNREDRLHGTRSALSSRPELGYGRGRMVGEGNDVNKNWLVLVALTGAGTASAQDSAVAVSVGARAWNAQWTTFGYLTDPN